MNGEGQFDDLALLSVTPDFFSRLSPRDSSDCGFYEISELGSMAHAAFKNAHSSPTSANASSTIFDRCSADISNAKLQKSGSYQNFDYFLPATPIITSPTGNFLPVLDESHIQFESLVDPLPPDISRS